MRISRLFESNGRHRLDAFSTIEMLGALAILTLLAVCLLPPTINAMMESKAVATVSGYMGIYAATTNHFQAYGSFGVKGPSPTTAMPMPIKNWDNAVLIPEGFLNQQLQVPIGQSTVVQVVTGPNASGGAGYYLYSPSVNSSASMTYVVEIMVTGVPQELAYNVATMLNGTLMTPTNKVQPITMGKVNYDGSSVMYMYVANGN